MLYNPIEHSDETLLSWIGKHDILLLVSRWYPHANFTCISCFRMEHSVCIGDELKLPVQSGEKRTRQFQVHLSLPFKRDLVHCSSHIKSPQCCCQIHLLCHLHRFGKKRTRKFNMSMEKTSVPNKIKTPKGRNYHIVWSCFLFQTQTYKKRAIVSGDINVGQWWSILTNRLKYQMQH